MNGIMNKRDPIIPLPPPSKFVESKGIKWYPCSTLSCMDDEDLLYLPRVNIKR